MRRETTTADAKAERQAELSGLSKPPSKSAIKRNLRKHRDEEMVSLGAEALRNQPDKGGSVRPFDVDDTRPSSDQSMPGPSAADLAMRQLNDEEFGNASE